MMVDVIELNGRVYIEVAGCPYCGGDEVYGFYMRPYEVGDPDRGRICPVCGEWITGADVEEWLEENDPELLERIKEMVEKENY